MSHPYTAFCDDFYINMRLGSQMSMPHQRETMLHFFERVQKQFPAMSRFRKGDSNDYTLEEDRSTGSYRWAAIEAKRLVGGCVNPDDIDSALQLHKLLLQMAPCHLGISPLEIEYVDLLFGFDLAYSGNHDEVIAESMFAGSPLTTLADEFGAKPVDFQPSVTVALSDDCRLQARIDIVTRTSSRQVRTGEYNEDAISVYLILRRYWGDQPKEPLEQVMQQLAERAEQLCGDHIVPRILRPISSAIASRS